MTSDTRTPAEIEREIEAERSELTSNLEGLQNKFSIDTLVRQVGDQFREHGGDLGRSISDQVKANPIPLALTGIGLAWMMFGDSRTPAAGGGFSRSGNDHRPRRRSLNRPHTPPVAGFDDHDSSPSWSRGEPDHGQSYADRLSEGAATARDKAAEGAGAAGSGLSSAASSVADTASSARSAVESGAESVRSGVAAAGARIAEGTEALTEEGRKRVIAAREKAVEMKRSATRSASEGADAVADFYAHQPLVIGALALAAGAALGGALPRTKVEDDLMGDQSDALFGEAERVFEEEKAKAAKVAQSVLDEVKEVADEMETDLDRSAPAGKSAAEAVGDTARSSVDRVTDAAMTTAKEEKLGEPKI